MELNTNNSKFKGVTDLILTLDGKLPQYIVDTMLANAFNYYISDTIPSEIEMMHERIWTSLPEYDIQIEINPLNDYSEQPEITELPEKIFPNPIDDLIEKSNTTIKKSKKLLDNEQENP